MSLLDGQSEVDGVTVRLDTLDREIKTWDSYSIREDFLTPTASFEFTLSTNAPSAYNEMLVDGAKIQIFVNELEQLTGSIEHVRVTDNRASGIVFNVSGRDFIGPVVTASIDPKIRITSNQTVADFLTAVLAPFGLSKIYIGDDINYGIITGYAKGRGKAQTRTFTAKEAQSRAVSADGKSAEVVYKTSTVTEVISRNRKDLKTIPLDQLKPKIGDGAMDVIQRLLSRLGLHMWAAADGSGVIVDAPDYETPPIHKLIRHYNGGDENNIIDGIRELNGECQPSCVIAIGASSGSDMAKIRLKCIAVNELVAVYPSGAIAQSVSDIIARYNGIKVLPLRKQLIPSTDRIVARRKPVPMFIKDDESKTIEQLVAFARRKLAEKQRDYSTATYVVRGHTYGGTYPYAVNTMIDVDDDYLNIHEPMWVMGKTFTKSRGEGTRTELRLIKPYTLELGS